MIRDGQAIGAMLTQLGAGQAPRAWHETQGARAGPTRVSAPANLDTANQARRARAAQAATAGVQAALTVLGDDVPPHLALADRRASTPTTARASEPKF